MIQISLTNKKTYTVNLDLTEFVKIINSKEQFIYLEVEFTDDNGNYHRDYESEFKKIVLNKNQILELI